jgi:hypothetical protein
MKPSLALLYSLLLAACVAPGTSVQTIDGTRLTVRTDDNYFWPDSFVHKDTDGTDIVIDVFPIVTALVVSRADGKPLTEADEAIARQAVNFYCDDSGAGLPGSGSRFADGTWAFDLCTSPSPIPA